MIYFKWMENGDIGNIGQHVLHHAGEEVDIEDENVTVLRHRMVDMIVLERFTKLMPTATIFLVPEDRVSSIDRI